MNLYPVVILVTALQVASCAQSFCDDYNAMNVSCFNQPPDCSAVNDCEMTMVVVPDEDSLTFTLTGKSDGWIAVGISGDQSMGSDDVLMCLQNGGKVDLLDRFNVKDDKINRASGSQILGTSLTLTTSSFTNGLINCTFNRAKEVNGSLGPETFSLKNSSRYLLIGRGPASGDEPSMHLNNPWVSTQAIDLSAGDKIETESSDTPIRTVTDAPTERPSTTDAANNALYISRFILAITLALTFFRLV